MIAISHLQFQHACLAAADAIWWLHRLNLSQGRQCSSFQSFHWTLSTSFDQHTSRICSWLYPIFNEKSKSWYSVNSCSKTKWHNRSKKKLLGKNLWSSKNKQYLHHIILYGYSTYIHIYICTLYMILLLIFCISISHISITQNNKHITRSKWCHQAKSFTDHINGLLEVCKRQNVHHTSLT